MNMEEIRTLKSSEVMKEIIQYLSILKYYVELHNDIGNTDINKKSEDFFCELLNLVFKLNLENLNRFKINFPAIDLGDKEKRICYQITATSTLEKIKDTLDTFREERLYKEFDIINILIIGSKKKHNKKIEYSEFKFTYKDNLFDLNDLTKEIAKKSTKELEEILSFFRTEFSNSIIDKIKKAEEDKSLYVEETILEDKHICYYSYGLGQVRVDAYLPASIEQKLSCLILFQQPGLSDCMISFEEETINTIFFSECDTGLTEKRSFIWYMDGEKIGIRFPNNRFVTNVETAKQLCEVISHLYKKYSKAKQKLHCIIGASGFKEEQQGEFQIVRVPKYIWIVMVDFAQKHDHYYGETEWDIFRPLNLHKKNHITIYKNHLNEVKADILAELHVKDMSSSYVDIFWKSGYTPLVSKMEGFDNLIKWKVDYTHDWILEEFIPHLFYLDFLRNRNMFKRLFKTKLTFGEFKNGFRYSQYSIESLTFKNNTGYRTYD